MRNTNNKPEVRIIFRANTERINEMMIEGPEFMVKSAVLALIDKVAEMCEQTREELMEEFMEVISEYEEEQEELKSVAREMPEDLKEFMDFINKNLN